MATPPPQLTADLLLQAYRIGVFPMSESRDDPEIFWVDPRQRGIIPLDGFRMSRSLARSMRRGHFRVSGNTVFADVVRGCANRPETWINAEIFRLYQQLHDNGHAHSVEVWQDDELVGGVYGVAIGGAFFGESMFSTATDASKTALAHLVDRLRTAGFSLFDTQFITPHLASLGAIEIPRDRYKSLLKKAITLPVNYPSDAAFPSAQDVIQRSIHTS